jgi:hypothetical protein
VIASDSLVFVAVFRSSRSSAHGWTILEKPLHEEAGLIY